MAGVRADSGCSAGADALRCAKRPRPQLPANRHGRNVDASCKGPLRRAAHPDARRRRRARAGRDQQGPHRAAVRPDLPADHGRAQRTHDREARQQDDAVAENKTVAPRRQLPGHELVLGEHGRQHGEAVEGRVRGQQQDQQEQEEQESQEKDGEGEEQTDEDKASESDENKDKSGEKSNQEEPAEEQSDLESDLSEREQMMEEMRQKLQNMNITPEQAAQILDAMNNAELRYIQQNKKKPTKRPDSSLPDW